MPLVHDPRGIIDVDAVEPALLGEVGMICMIVGVNHITESNVEDFWRRCYLMERTTGSFRTRVKDDESGVEPVYVTKEDALSLIGYRCNASPMTKAAFKTHLFNTFNRLVAF